ncbi:MAG: hypothetical protein CVU01_01975 [Bacteroidetes bacterium HGW-Bacteroidetes-18]|nr:MAG: hypothetical protein CVU01_01975 [Bacteroidetes bacterium HGW-Bacteroidetes-18]
MKNLIRYKIKIVQLIINEALKQERKPFWETVHLNCFRLHTSQAAKKISSKSSVMPLSKNAEQKTWIATLLSNF